LSKVASKSSSGFSPSSLFLPIIAVSLVALVAYLAGGAILSGILVAGPVLSSVAPWFAVGVVALIVNVYFKQAFRREVRLNAIEQLIKQLGIKDFHPKDLNSDKLDDRGYARLLGLITTLYATQTGNPYGANAAIGQANQVLAQLAQLNQLGQQGQQFQQPPGQPTTP